MIKLLRFSKPPLPLPFHLPPFRFKSSTIRRRRRIPNDHIIPGTSCDSTVESGSVGASSLLENITEIIGVGFGADRGGNAAGTMLDGKGDGEGRSEGRRNRKCSFSDHITQGVRRNSPQQVKPTLWKEHRDCDGDDGVQPLVKEVMEVDEDCDVSPMVGKITQIVQFDAAGKGMEERLAESFDGGMITINPEIVEKVLKSCFKVGDLGRRFFDWCKLQPGFQHTTETYNVMLYIAGDSMVLETLLSEMDRSSVPKNIKTWSTVVSQYGKYKQIGMVVKTYQDMIRSGGCKPDQRLLETLIRILCDSKEADLAMEFYHDMTKNTEMEISNDLLETLLRASLRSGNHENASLLRADLIENADESVAYRRLFRSFCSSGKLDEAQTILLEMKNRNISFSLVDRRILLKNLCFSDKPEETLAFFETMKTEEYHQIDSDDYGVLIYGLLKEPDYFLPAILKFHEMKKLGLVPTVATYTQIIRHLLKSSDGGCCSGIEASKLYDEMIENGVQPDIVTATTLLSGYIRNNNISEAINVFKKMTIISNLTSEVYSTFVKNLCIKSHPLEAFDLIFEMLKISDVKLDDKTSNLAVSSLHHIGQLAKARKLQDIFTSGELYPCTPEVLPNEKSGKDWKSDDATMVRDLNEICEVLTSPMKDWEWMKSELEKKNLPTKLNPCFVLEILRRVRRNGHAALSFFSWITTPADTATPARFGHENATDAYNMAMKIAGGAKDFKHMRRLFLDMKRRRCLITADTWTIIIFQYGRAGLTSIALDYFRQMKLDGIQPNRTTFNLILIFLSESKRDAEASFKIFREMISEGYIPDEKTLSSYLTYLSNSGHFSQARASVNILQKTGFSPKSANYLLIRCLSRSGRMDDALKLFDEMPNVDNAHVYGSLIHGLLRAGRSDDAESKLKEMSDSGIPYTTHIYTSLIVHFFRIGQIAKAIETFEKMVSPESILKPTVVTYSAMIRGLCSAGMVEDSWIMFRRMRSDGVRPDFELYSVFLKCLCKVGRAEEAMSLLTEMMNGGISPSCVNFKTVFYGLNLEGKSDLSQNVLRMKRNLALSKRFTA
ncbi:hypothetical protein ZOSMA_486G00150 [Zostera marina]|uniref:PROP1-like PPR domain-containing protein n=1 Tax=Zostera marina TaxID=29655 RepID=A0A0K9P1U7_ZOSMR|nr:hypothetical protein ZOSMA_486G00150 [Zostera marina]